MSKRRILLQLGQLPGDPASGAARSMLGTVEMLAADAARWEVFSLGTSASEKRGGIDIHDYFRQLGVVPEEGDFSGRRVWRFEHRGVQHCVLDVGDAGPLEWEKLYNGVFDRLYEQTLRKRKIDVVVTFGGRPEAFERRRIAKKKGCRVVFGLRNWGYLVPGAFENVDAVFTPSEFVTAKYRKELRQESTAIPVPIEWDDVVAEKQERVFITAINPSPEKGLFFLARLVEELGAKRPDIPVLVVESRGVGAQLIAAGRTAGFELSRHESLMLSQGVAKPRDIYAVTRVLLAPSVWEEPAGRVAAEAMVNGIPAIVSDRGGLSEMAGDGGIVLPLPDWMTPQSQQVPTAEEVDEWFKWIVRLVDDEEAYAQWSEKARKAGDRYQPERLAALVRDFFAKVVQK